jgi:two-component system, sensor histidine kinase and response regulator
MQVLGSLELLDHKLKGTDDIRAQTILRLARRSAEQVNSTFEGMLLWAKLSTGQLPFKPADLSLKAQLDRTVEQLHLPGNIKRINIKNSLESDLRVYADPNMLSCILLNLVYNAIKFTPVGGEVVLSATHTENETEITISDNGKGVGSEHKATLFSGSMTNAGTNNETGTGIGLVICKDFVVKHRGRIEVESEVGNGTKVRVSLPKHSYHINSQLGLPYGLFNPPSPLSPKDT